MKNTRRAKLTISQTRDRWQLVLPSRRVGKRKRAKELNMEYGNRVCSWNGTVGRILSWGLPSFISTNNYKFLDSWEFLNCYNPACQAKLGILENKFHWSWTAHKFNPINDYGSEEHWPLKILVHGDATWYRRGELSGNQTEWELAGEKKRTLLSDTRLPCVILCSASFRNGQFTQPCYRNLPHSSKKPPKPWIDLSMSLSPSS